MNNKSRNRVSSLPNQDLYSTLLVMLKTQVPDDHTAVWKQSPRSRKEDASLLRGPAWTCGGILIPSFISPVTGSLC
jgi:hypothetical protein